MLVLTRRKKKEEKKTKVLLKYPSAHGFVGEASPT